MLKGIIGLILVLAGIVFGIWAGIGWGFIGGLILIFESFQGASFDAADCAVGMARVFFATPIGVAAAIIPCGIGGALLSD